MTKFCAYCNFCVRIESTGALICIEAPEAFYVSDKSTCADWESVEVVNSDDFTKNDIC